MESLLIIFNHYKPLRMLHPGFKAKLMNLYKIIFSHHGPKDSEEGVKTLVAAESDEQVYNWLASDPGEITTCWKYNENIVLDSELGVFTDVDGDETDQGWYDDDGNPEDYKTRMIRLCGDINDENESFDDLYYGVTLYGWEMIDENVDADKIEYLSSVGFCIPLA
jgi:hypothetical protein